MQRLADIMTRDVVRFTPDTEMLRALHVLLSRGISGAAVTDGTDMVIGMLSQRDCLRAALEGAYHREWGGPVSAVMRPEVESLSPDLDLLTAARAFVERPYRRFPVLENGRLIGIVSRSDVLRALAASWRP